MNTERRMLRTVLWLVGALVLTVWFLFFRSFHADDAAIYAHIVRRWARDGVASFNTVDRAFPVTGHLWFLLNAVLAKTLSVGNVYGLMRANSMLFYLCSWVLFYIVSRRSIRSPYVAVGTALLLATDEIALENSATGMETSLATFIIVLYIYLFGSKLGGFAAGLGTVTRPECLLLVVVHISKRLQQRKWKQAMWFGALALLSVIPVVLSVLALSPSLVDTLFVKSSGFSILFSKAVPNLLRSGIILGVISSGPVILLVLFGRRYLARSIIAAAKEPIAQVGLLFTLTTVLGYVALHSRDFLKARYFVGFVPFVYLALGIIADKALSCSKRPAIWLFACSANMLLIFAAGVPNSIENQAMYAARLKEVEMLERHTGPDDAYYTGAIGIVGYATELEILDPMGLATPAAVPPNSVKECEEILNLYQPGFVKYFGPPSDDPASRTHIDWSACFASFEVIPLETQFVELVEFRWLAAINETPRLPRPAQDGQSHLWDWLFVANRVPIEITLYQIIGWRVQDRG